MLYISLLTGFTALILIVGIIVMAVGGKLNRKYSSKLMSLRVILQAAAVAVIAVAYLLGSAKISP